MKEQLTKAYRQRLMRELISRQSVNPAYSLRNFARDLNISPSSLSQTLNAKRDLSKVNLAKVANHLAFSPQELTEAMQEISQSTDYTEDSNFQTLPDDVFHLMSDWYYFAIVSLAAQKRAKADVNWLARRFGITTMQAADALNRLKRLELVQIKNGMLVSDGKPLRTQTDVPSSAARKLQHNHLKLAGDSLERDPLELRDMTSMTMTVERKRIAKAKEMIKRFRRKMARFLEGGGKGEEVYVFALQLFPVSKEVSDE